MGLDMYLEREVYVGGNYEHRKVTGNIDIKIKEVPLRINLEEVSSIIIQTAYWRKVNAVHSWFVENVQEGIDECQRSYVSVEQLRELRELCVQTIELVKGCSKIVSLEKDWNDEEYTYVKYDVDDLDLELTPQAGFFFGSQEIDIYFIQDLEETVKMLSNLSDRDSYYYQASW